MSLPIYTLNGNDYEGAISFPVIKIVYIPQLIDFSRYKVVICTSKNGFLALSYKQQQMLRDKTVICVGAVTAQLLTAYGIEQVLYPKQNSALELFKTYISALQRYTPKIIYLRGEKIAFDAHSYLSDFGVTLDECIVYKSQFLPPSSRLPPPKSWIILSSPFIVECFTKVASLKDYQLLIIGEKTAQALPQYIDYTLSPKQSIRESIDFLSGLAIPTV